MRILYYTSTTSAIFVRGPPASDNVHEGGLSHSMDHSPAEWPRGPWIPPAWGRQFPTSTICAFDGTPLGLTRNSIYGPGGIAAPIGGAVPFNAPGPPLVKLSWYAP